MVANPNNVQKPPLGISDFSTDTAANCSSTCNALFDIDSHFAFSLGKAKPKQLQGGYLMALWGHNNTPVFTKCKFTAAETPMLHFMIMAELLPHERTNQL